MDLQEALVPHWASAAFWSLITPVGEQMRPQFLLVPVEDWSTHWGSAVTPAGLSLGQALEVQSGLQKSPSTPVTCTDCSSARQPLAGSP